MIEPNSRTLRASLSSVGRAWMAYCECGLAVRKRLPVGTVLEPGFRGSRNYYPIHGSGDWQKLRSQALLCCRIEVTIEPVSIMPPHCASSKIIFVVCREGEEFANGLDMCQRAKLWNRMAKSVTFSTMSFKSYLTRSRSLPSC